MKKIISIFIIVVLATAVVLYFGIQKKSSTIGQSNTQTSSGTEVMYACNEGKTITATYNNKEPLPPVAEGEPPRPEGSVHLMLSDGRDMTLVQTISASGVRYANEDESFVFWEKGNGALVLERNEEKSYIGCIAVAPKPADSDLNEVYSNNESSFSLRLPEQLNVNLFSINEAYSYQLSPEKTIRGVQFIIPSALAEGTNLSKDSYMSIETLPQADICNASLFLYGEHPMSTIEDDGVQYSVASSGEAGAGNRWEETVYAIPGTNPCIAVRYFIHYTVFENYDPGTIREFDKEALIRGFDTIRHTLTVR